MAQRSQNYSGYRWTKQAYAYFLRSPLSNRYFFSGAEMFKHTFEQCVTSRQVPFDGHSSVADEAEEDANTSPSAKTSPMLPLYMPADQVEILSKHFDSTRKIYKATLLCFVSHLHSLVAQMPRGNIREFTSLKPWKYCVKLRERTNVYECLYLRSCRIQYIERCEPVQTRDLAPLAR